MTWTLNHLTNRPDPKAARDASLSRADVLSHLLSWVRLNGESVYRTELQDPWRLAFPPGPAHLHLVTEGCATVELGDGTRVLLEAGDLALLPHGQGHEVYSETGRGLEPQDIFDNDIFDSRQLLVSNAGSGATAKFIGGLFRYDRMPLPPVLNSLPPIISLKAPAENVSDWRGSISVFLLDEVMHPSPGSSLMISRIIDLMVIRTLRSWAEQQPVGTAWLGGSHEERVGRALTAMHEDPARPWTVEKLAMTAGMSRSVFAERFAHATGDSPLRYLMRWRLSLALDLLEQGRLAVGEVGRAVGYDSEAGFSRAFKAFYGSTPSSYRSSDPNRQDVLT